MRHFYVAETVSSMFAVTNPLHAMMRLQYSIFPTAPFVVLYSPKLQSAGIRDIRKLSQHQAVPDLS